MDLQVLHDELHAKIDEIDVVLDSQTDAKTAGKRSIVTGLIENAQKTWEPVSTQLIEQLSSAPTEVQIGIYYGLLRALNGKFSKSLGEAVEKMVEEIPETPTETIPEEELKKLSAARSEIYAKIKQLNEMNDTFGGGADMRMARRRAGAIGKRGPRAISSYVWTIDSTEFSKLKEVAEAYDQYEKTADLTKAMRDAKIDLKNPSDRIEFTMPDGKILVGVKDTEKVVDPNESDDDNDPDEDEEEVTA